MTKLILVTTTVSTAEQAERLASAVVAERLAACVQVLPVRSTYRWQGKLERTEERLLLIKTRAALLKTLTEFIHERHPYDLPEVLATAVHDGAPAYLAWVEKETEPTPARAKRAK